MHVYTGVSFLLLKSYIHDRNRGIRIKKINNSRIN